MLHSTGANAQLWSKLNLGWLHLDFSPSPLINVGSEIDCEVCFPNYSPQVESILTPGARGRKGKFKAALMGKGLIDDLSSYIPYLLRLFIESVNLERRGREGKRNIKNVSASS